MLINPSTDLSSQYPWGQPSSEYDPASQGFVFSVPQPDITGLQSTPDLVNGVGLSASGLANSQYSAVKDIPGADEWITTANGGNQLGSGGLDALYGDGFSEALVLRWRGQLTPSNPHYNTILQQESAAQINEIQNQQIFGMAEQMFDQGIAPIGDFALNSSSNSDFIAGLTN